MGSDQPSNEEKPPTCSLVQRVSDESSTSMQNEAAERIGISRNPNDAEADSSSFHFVAAPVAPFPGMNVNKPYQSYRSAIPAGYTQLNYLQNPLTGPNFLNIRSNLPSQYGPVLRMSSHGENMQGMSSLQTHDNRVTADNVINSATHFNSIQHAHYNRNSELIRGDAAGDNQISRQGGRAYGSDFHGTGITRNYVGIGGNAPMLNHHQSRGNLSINNNGMVCAVPFCSSEQVDGSFLTLGVGCDNEARTEFDLNSEVITDKLDEAIPSQLNIAHAQQSTRNFSNLGLNLAGGFSSFQNNVGGFSSLVHNVGGQSLGDICGTNTGPSSSPFHSLQQPQIGMQYDFPMSSSRNSGFLGDRDARYANLGPHFPMSSNRNSGFLGDRDARYANLGPYRGLIGNPSASSGPSGSISAGLADPRQPSLSGSASPYVPLKEAITRPTSDQLQKCSMGNVQNLSPESFMVSPFVGIRGSSTMQNHSGQLFSTHDGSATRAIGGDLYPHRIMVQDTEGSAAQAAARGGMFPKRLGIQVSEAIANQAAEHGLCPKGIGPQTACKVGQPLGSIPDQCPINFPESAFSTGQLQNNVRGQFPIHGCGRSLPTGYSQEGGPSHCSRDFLRPVSAIDPLRNAQDNGLSQGSSVLRRPFPKRGASQPPPAAPRVQRRRVSFPPPIRPSIPSPNRTALPVPAPASVHIKWQGFDELPQPSGEKCHLCNRDLSFTPDGPVYQPANAPSVAVLPCAHTFHDHCLQNITPKEQAKDPPCIPCALNRN